MKILYVHGLGSTKDGNTVNNLREELSEHDVVSFDVPIDPNEAYETVIEWSQDCDLVIGSSLGGFYAQFAECPKVLINPALQATKDIMDVEGKGTFQYFGPRVDGVQEYTLDDQYYADLAQVEEFLYEECMDANDFATTYIVFGTEDEELGGSNWPMALDMYPEDNIHYFEGMGHRMEEAFMDRLMGIIMLALDY